MTAVVLLEEAVSGFEVGCAVLGSEELTVGLVDEIQLSGGFFDFDGEVHPQDLRHPLPCPHPSGGGRPGIQEAAQTIYRALDCRGFARVDLFLTAGGAQLLFNEVNTIPGFTAHSRYPNYDAGRRPGLHLPGQPHDPSWGWEHESRLRLRREQTYARARSS